MKAWLWQSFVHQTKDIFNNLLFIGQSGLLIGLRWHISFKNRRKFVLTHILCPTPVQICAYTYAMPNTSHLFIAIYIYTYQYTQ